MPSTKHRRQTQAIEGGKTSLSGKLSNFYKLDKYSHRDTGFINVNPVYGEVLSPPKLDRQAKFRWGGSWLDWCPRKLDAILSYGPPNYNYAGLSLSKLDEDTTAELTRFLLCLEIWERTPGKKKITPWEVWSKSLRFGASFAEELSDMFDLGWRDHPIAPDTYNFVFPSRCLPRWKCTSEDLAYALIPTHSDPDALENFRLTLRKVLNKYVPASEIIMPSDSSIKMERSTTTSYDSFTGKTEPQWALSFKESRFEKSRIIGKRCIVPVYPGGIRDTIITDISANYSIRWLERALLHILEYIPESADTLFSHTHNARLHDVVNSKGWHVLRDIKKCGLTYNVKDLFPILKEEISNIIPDKRWERYDIFQDLTVVDGDQEYKTLRGYGLGMANHSVTLCNIVIYYMSLDVLCDHRKDLNIKSKAIVGNDDQDVFFSQEEAARQYFEIEKDIQGSLGNLWHPKKSVVKPFGLFYEHYSLKGWKDKEALVCNALACAYLAPDIRCAKTYIKSQSHRFVSPWAWRELKTLATFWGAEFFDVESELYIHSEIGGWLDTRSMGLKTTLRDIDYLVEKEYASWLIGFSYQVCTRYNSPPRPQKKREEMVSNFRYIGPSKKSNPMCQIYTLGDEDLMEYYKKLTSFERNLKSRKVNLGRIIYKDMNLDRIRRRLLSASTWYAIPDSMVIGPYPCSFENLTVPLVMESQRPVDDLIDYLLYHEPDNMIQQFNWNINIPHEIANYEYTVPPECLIKGTQFSNCGILPIAEYFKRWKVYPDIESYVPTKEIGVYDSSRAPIPSLSYFKRMAKDAELIPEDEFDLGFVCIDDINTHNIQQELDNLLKEQRPEEEILDDIDRLMDFAKGMSLTGEHRTGNLYSIGPSFEGPEEESDDEPMDFSMFD
jgi:hypothetical protein